MIFKAIVHREDDGGFWAEVPSLPGCSTQGDTREELIANLREAIESVLAVDIGEVGSERDEVLELAL